MQGRTRKFSDKSTKVGIAMYEALLFYIPAFVKLRLLQSSPTFRLPSLSYQMERLEVRVRGSNLK